MEFFKNLFCNCKEEIIMKEYQYYKYIHDICVISCLCYSSFIMSYIIYNKYRQKINVISYKKENFCNYKVEDEDEEYDSDNDGTVEIKEKFDNLFKPVKIQQEDKISLLSSSFPEFDATIGSVNDL